MTEVKVIRDITTKPARYWVKRVRDNAPSVTLEGPYNRKAYAEHRAKVLRGGFWNGRR